MSRAASVHYKERLQPKDAGERHFPSDSSGEPQSASPGESLPSQRTYPAGDQKHGFAAHSQDAALYVSS
ncbi:hypothetical protein DV515_00017574 [Chloebia gouldiae]|uniref:Uncharacterized protein n=1 Tax=Chloebia gouldiae TaxID=44316 RepID=A0A3L8QA19_CHLGU|nr:hypothetical protein DV515_00017574 [Chloebia gouldiae]